MGKKLYLIGIDAAPLWLIKKFSQEKNMASFNKMIKENDLIEMESTLPPMTGAAWPTIYTGLNPGKHGVPDFFVMKNDYTPDLVYYDSSKNPPFWKDIALSGKRCLVITPATDITLPEYPNVDMITGFPLKARTNNNRLEALMKKYDFYGEPDVEKEMKSGKMTEKEGSMHFLKSTEARTKLAIEAMKEEDYDFVYVCYTETDRLQHFVLNKKNMDEYLLPIYQSIGRYLDHVMRLADKEKGAVMIVSDHGAQPIKYKFLINSWMIKNGYAKLKGSIMEKITDTSKSSEATESDSGYGVRDKLLKSRLRNVYDRLPHSMKGIVSKSAGRILPASNAGRYTRIHLFDYDMENTKAFAAISNINVATIWINDKRFRKGSVSPSEKDKLKREISKKLLSLKDKEGKKLIYKIYDGSAYYGKTSLFIPPDLFVEAMPGYMIDIFNFSSNSLFMEPEPPKRGDHTKMGIYGFYPWKNEDKTKTFKINDVYQTVLDYYGIKKKKR